MTETIDTTAADRALKAQHRAMWALGDYPSVGERRDRASWARSWWPRPGSAPATGSLDVAAGSGNAAVPAALTGAEVVASDLTPELFAAGRRVRGAPRRRADLGGGRRRGAALPGRRRSTSCCPASG